jgi:hypothetical protein
LASRAKATSATIKGRKYKGCLSSTAPTQELTARGKAMIEHIKRTLYDMCPKDQPEKIERLTDTVLQ